MSNAIQTTENVTETEDNLIHLEGNLEDNNTQGNPNELNTKINHIDTSLDDLKKELNEVNEDVKDSLITLSDKGADLTGRVSATYKQLGNLEKSYHSLAERSTQIKEEINGVSTTLAELSDKSGADIEKLTEGHSELIEKTQVLVEKSRKTARKLNKSIKENGAAMKLLEQRLTAEIESLASRTQDRDDELEENLKTQQAKLLQLQEVDKALEKRAISLEQATEDLHSKSKELSKSHNLLNHRANDLAADIVTLQEQTHEHSGLIHTIQERESVLSGSVVELAKLEKKHFIGVSAVLAVLILAFIAYTMNQQSNWKTEGVTNTTVQTELQTINNKLLTINDHVQSVDERVQNMDDSVNTLDGRMNTVTPLSQFGGDNTIHGPQWLAQQSGKQFVIQLALVSDKQRLYKIATQYSFYLKEKLAFMPVGNDQYVLLYGGFQNPQDAQMALGNLPHYINFDRPVIYRLGDIQDNQSR